MNRFKFFHWGIPGILALFKLPMFIWGNLWCEVILLYAKVTGQITEYCWFSPNSVYISVFVLLFCFNYHACELYSLFAANCIHSKCVAFFVNVCQPWKFFIKKQKIYSNKLFKLSVFTLFFVNTLFFLTRKWLIVICSKNMWPLFLSSYSSLHWKRPK